MNPNPVTGILIRRGKVDTETEGGRACDKRGSRLKQCIYKPRDAEGCGQPTEARKRQGGAFPLPLHRKHSPANSLILDFQPPDLGGNTFLLFQATQFVTAALGN